MQTLQSVLFYWRIFPWSQFGQSVTPLLKPVFPLDNIYSPDEEFGIVKIEPNDKLEMGSYEREDALELEEAILNIMVDYHGMKPCEMVLYNVKWFTEEDNPNHQFLRNHFVDIRKDKLVVCTRRGPEYDWEVLIDFKNPKLGS